MPKQKNAINISTNTFDAQISSPRAITAVFCLKKRKTNLITYKIYETDITKGTKTAGSDSEPAKNKTKTFIGKTEQQNNIDEDPVELNQTLIITNDILSMDISTKKGGISHSAEIMLAPDNDVDYLNAIAPSDYIMCWIVNSQEKYNDIIKRLQENKPCNKFDDGLKFFGQVLTIGEKFRTAANGVKSTRYSLSCQGFNWYNGMIYYSPFLNAEGNSTGSQALFANELYSTLNSNVVGDIVKESLSIQDQFLVLHKIFLGNGPGENKSLIKTPNRTFAAPSEIIKIFNKTYNKSGEPDPEYTIADLMNVLIGVQIFEPSNEFFGALGPAFNRIENFVSFKNKTYGQYYGVTNAGGVADPAFKIKGRKPMSMSPTLGGTIWSILNGVSNPVINEMYVTLRPSPTNDSDIQPTLVCRQLPFAKYKLDNFNSTLFFELPRFILDPNIVLDYDVSRTDQLRFNAITLRFESNIFAVGDGKGIQNITDSAVLSTAPWSFDINDIKTKGMRILHNTCDQDYLDFSNEDSNTQSIITSYMKFLISIYDNLHLTYTGTIQTFGIQEPICIGENLLFDGVLFHIESVSHSYAVNAGLPVFRSKIGVSHGIHTFGEIDYFNDKHIQPFRDIRSGITKEGESTIEIDGK